MQEDIQFCANYRGNYAVLLGNTVYVYVDSLMQQPNHNSHIAAKKAGYRMVTTKHECVRSETITRDEFLVLLLSGEL